MFSHGHHEDHGRHGHDHTHAPSGSFKALVGVLALTGTIFFAELIAGVVSGSLALLSDAMHMLSDSTGLLIALVAMLLGRRAATHRATYGHRRVEVLAAMVNATAVTAISIWIVISAIGRLGGHHPIDTDLMLIVAVIGLCANAVSAFILVRRQHESLNLRGAYLHVLSDLIGSMAVIIAGLVIRFTGWLPADTIASLFIAALVLPRSLRLLWESVSVLMNRVPRGVNTREVEAALTDLRGVTGVHDLHIWSTDGTEPLATCHLVVADGEIIDGGSGGECPVLDSAQARLRDFGIHHSTIQLERTGHAHHEEVC
ncbi:cation diffusion facilitator family transporter [Corynebacterium halotolerans]|uniref:Co/Zn/Cd efflux system transmembrane protein n=1 Tax=Corynebacterium halotolerans YIM 70093 = DSM 44683 TaxID=1121362 RepID=M1NS38_9CORY|nr:cation diffusion facilitator family transporter [Corynebacterium halotolerans]AGF72302.1 Co/Zn/Cd efflux system transmembrane protein [Corynebacterium halotolerans YIM 70093 = DSM 44683]